jgi:hypothetical protein
MRAREFIKEDFDGVKKDYLHTMVPSIIATDMDMYYEFYRWMTAIAGEPEIKADQSNNHFRDNPVAMAYTPQEQDMLLNSLKKFGKKFKYLTKTKSQESPGIHSVSPVPQNSGRRIKK